MDNFQSQSPLLFPFFVRIPNQYARLSNSNPDLEAMPIYRLEWDSVDRAKKSKPLSVNDFTPLTSPEWKSTLDNLTFAVSAKYREEILHYARLAQDEWCRSRPFPTGLSWACLEVAEKAVGAAFHLLTDCLWDKEAKAPNRLSKGYWTRGEDKELIRVASLVRFWDRQLGQGHIWWKCELDRLEERLKNGHTSDRLLSSDEKYRIRSLLDTIKDRMKLVNPEGMFDSHFGPEDPEPKFKVATRVAKPAVIDTLVDSPTHIDNPGHVRPVSRVTPSRTRIIVRDEGEPGDPTSENVILDNTTFKPVEAPRYVSPIDLAQEEIAEAKRKLAELKAEKNRVRRSLETMMTDGSLENPLDFDEEEFVTSTPRT